MTSILEYIWLDGTGGIRSKTRILGLIHDLSQLPEWSYDGSSTDQAINNGSNTEIILVPVRMIPDPFRQESKYNFIVLCATYTSDRKPAINNNRDEALEIFNRGIELEPWYGLEQEYFMIELNNLKFENQRSYYCVTGYRKPETRLIAEKHLYYCLYAGLKICGLNSEVAPNQWEYQIGPCLGIEAADQLILSRYILEGIAEIYNYVIIYKPKIHKDLNGSGCHVNFSTNETREENGIIYINSYIDRLKYAHTEHISFYGKGNEERLTGLHETSSINEFTSGIGTRNTSIRIPDLVQKNGCGYLEDRRPASNIDPYIVTSRILATCCL